MPVLSIRSVRELNVKLTACFQEGVSDGIAQMNDMYSADGKPLATALDLVYRTGSNTRDNVFTFPQVSFQIDDFGAGDGTGDEGIKLYETRLDSGNYKGKTIVVSLVDFEDDLVGQYKVVFYRLGRLMVKAPMRLVEGTLYLASTGSTIVSGIDGKPLFSTQHVMKPQEAYDATTNPYVSNDIVQPAGMTFGNFSELYSKFLAIPDEDGIPDEDNLPQYLYFDTDYLGTALDICYLDRPSQLSGGGNPWMGKVKPMPVRRLQGTGQWGLASSWDALDRSLIYVEREALKFRGLFTNPEDPIVRERRQLKWQADGRINCGAGNYRRIIRSRKS